MTDGGTATPLVSVVTVCFNSERYLAEAMESVLAQTYSHIEYIVVDGGSTDATLEIIRSFEPQFGGRLRWTSGPDEGIYDAMNKGIALCAGELIGLLNSDDRYLPDAVATIAEAAHAEPDAGLIYGDVEILSEEGEALRTEKAAEVVPGKRPDWLPMCHQSLFVRSTIYRELGVYDPAYRILADYDFVVRVLASGVKATRVDTPIAQFRLGGVCNTDTEAANAERERIRIAYGANPLVERVRRIRHAVNRRGWAVLSRLKAHSERFERVREEGEHGRAGH